VDVRRNGSVSGHSSKNDTTYIWRRFRKLILHIVYRFTEQYLHTYVLHRYVFQTESYFVPT
jgi:hypothetical protein